jgi:hypothetical protein
MILSKMFMNQIIGALIKHFDLDKIVKYVFEDNELDDKVKELEKKMDLLEKLSRPSKDCKCNYKEGEK